MNILVIHPRTAGDVLRTTPAVAALRRRRPEARIGFAVAEAFADVLRGNPEIDEVIGVGEAGPGTLRAFGADLVYNVAASEEAAAWAGAAGGKVIGYVLEDGRLSLRHPDPAEADGILRRRDRVNRIRFYLDLVGAPDGAPDVPTVVVGPEARGEAARLLGADPRPVCVIQPGAGDESAVWAVKRLPVEEVSLLAEALERDGFRIVTVGSRPERERAEIVAAMCRGALDLTGLTSWPALAAVLERADLYIGHDSGPSHLACALGRPSLVVFLGSSPVLNAPLGGPSLVVQSASETLLLCRGAEEEALRAFAEALDRTRAPVLRDAAQAVLLLAAGAEADPAAFVETARLLARVGRAGMRVWRDGRLDRPALRSDLRSLADAAARGHGRLDGGGNPAAERVVVYLHEVLSRYERAEVGYRDTAG
jgi:ADP-heptose:LPS heptosyltransferase